MLDLFAADQARGRTRSHAAAPALPATRSVAPGALSRRRRLRSAHTANASFTATSGTVVYDDNTKECTWNIGRLSKEGHSPSLNGSITLLPGRADEGAGD